MKNTIEDSTRQQALLDPIIVPDDMLYLDSGTIETPPSISDHIATCIRIPFIYQCQISFKRLVWIYKKANIVQLKEMISRYDRSILLEGSLNEACINFTKFFLEFVKICIPFNTVTVRPNDKPWFDSEIRYYSRIRDRLKQKSIKTGSSNDLTNYKHIRNKVNNLKKHAKEKFYNNLEISSSDFHTNDKKKIWQVIRHFVKNNNSSGNIPPLVFFNFS